MTTAEAVVALSPAVKQEKTGQFEVEVLLQSSDSSYAYVVFDLVNQRVIQAIPLVGQEQMSPSLIGMFKQNPQAPNEHLVLISQWSSTTHDSQIRVSTASFNQSEEEVDAGDCDWSFILESLHIAFMQQEAHHFEQTEFDTIEHATFESRRLFDEDFDNGSEGDDEANDFNSDSVEYGRSAVLWEVSESDSEEEDVPKKVVRNLSGSGSKSNSGKS